MQIRPKPYHKWPEFETTREMPMASASTFLLSSRMFAVFYDKIKHGFVFFIFKKTFAFDF